MKFNINSEVRIKLTPYGITILEAKYEHYNFTPPKVDVDGYCEMQLWKVMNIFGEILYNGNMPFDTIIQIDDALFET